MIAQDNCLKFRPKRLSDRPRKIIARLKRKKPMSIAPQLRSSMSDNEYAESNHTLISQYSNHYGSE